jgi:(2Fe-2S) ferredoxin
VIYSNLPRGLSIAPARRKPVSEPEEAISKRGKKSKKKAQKGGAPATLAKPVAKVRGYDAHVLVCKGGDCRKRGAKALRKSLKDELRAEGMNRDVRVDYVDCLGLCKHGPNLVVYPGGTWYLGVVERNVPQLVQMHLKNGDPVNHLAAELRSRKRAR